MRVIVLDTFPVSSLSKRETPQEPTVSDLCRQWITDCEAAGNRIVIPAITYYEALRELEQRQAIQQIARLKMYCLRPERFFALTTAHLEIAAQIWGKSRREGLPTADPHALDGDSILVAQVYGLGLDASQVIVATTNPAHLSRYVTADLWTNIQP